MINASKAVCEDQEHNQAKLADGTTLPHDNACCYVAHTVQDRLNAMQQEVTNILRTPQTYHHSNFI
jgi:hypothetical protein